MIKSILGIEEYWFKLTPKGEQIKYRFVVVLLLLVIVGVLISGYYMSYMIYKNLYVDILIGLFFGFTIFSIFRFSFSSIEKDYKLENQTTKILNLSFFFRLIILLIFGIFISFPLSCFFQRSEMQPQIDAQKLSIIDNYKQSKENSRINNVKIYDVKLEKLNLIVNSVLANKVSLQDSIELKYINDFDGELKLKLLENELTILNDKIETLNVRKSKIGFNFFHTDSA